MVLYILNKKYERFIVIDSYISLIWTERYIGAGEFDLVIPYMEELSTLNTTDYYVEKDDTDYIMLIETITYKFDETNGYVYDLKGRSLESLLDLRIVWNQTVLNGDLQNGIQKLLNENIINPSIANRKIGNFVFKRNSDVAIEEKDISAQYTGDNLYDVIVDICTANDVGYRIRLNSSDKFEFMLFRPTDRSRDQIMNTWVIFSNKYENLISASDMKSVTTLRNVALIAGEDSGTSRKKTTVGSAVGLYRRELYVDARDIQSDTDDGKLTDAQYTAQLQQRGKEKLSENPYTDLIEGDINDDYYIYGLDYNVGDIAILELSDNVERRVQISEVILSWDENGKMIIPAFVIKED